MQIQAWRHAPVKGHFRRTGEKQYRRAFACLALACCALAIFALARESQELIGVAVAAGVALLLLSRLITRMQRVKLVLAGAELRVTGGGYAISIEAPFRFQSGVERKPATASRAETCFVRLAVDVRGSPLVIEEQVHEGAYPPPLADIAGISSALGLAELTSETPYPGTLWALIERLESLREAEPLNTGDEELVGLLRAGDRLLDAERYDAAIDAFSAIIRRWPDSAQAYTRRGAARFAADRDLDKAIADLTTALRLQPGHFDVLRRRALVHARLGDWAATRADCSAALQMQPSNAELFNLRGTACYRLRDYEAALMDFGKSIRREPYRHQAYFNRGLTRKKLGDADGALSDYEAALRLQPDFAPAHRELQALRQRTAERELTAKS